MRNKVKGLVVAVAAFGMLCMAGSALADSVTPAPTTNTVSGDVEFMAEWNITATSWTPFEQITVENLRADNSTQEDFLVCDDLDVNGKFKISAKKSTWTLPASYDSSHTGAKYILDGSDTSLLIKVVVDDDGDADGTGATTVQNSFDSYKALTTENQQILSGGVYVDGGHASGVENAQFSIDSEVLIDYKTTVPGTYSNTITLTFAEDAAI